MSKSSKKILMTIDIDNYRTAYKNLQNKLTKTSPAILEQLRQENVLLESLIASFQKGEWFDTNDLLGKIEELESFITSFNNLKPMPSKLQFFSTGPRGVITSVSPEEKTSESDRERFLGIK